MKTFSPAQNLNKVTLQITEVAPDFGPPLNHRTNQSTIALRRDKPPQRGEPASCRPEEDLTLAETT